MQLQLEINQQLLEEAQVILSDKKKLQAEMVQLLHNLGVDATRKALPIEQVQQKMHEAGLGPYTLSEAIVAAREE